MKNQRKNREKDLFPKKAIVKTYSIKSEIEIERLMKIVRIEELL